MDTIQPTMFPLQVGVSEQGSERECGLGEDGLKRNTESEREEECMQVWLALGLPQCTSMARPLRIYI